MKRDEKVLLRRSRLRHAAEPQEEDVARVRVGERRGVGACRVSLAVGVHPTNGCVLAVLEPDLVVLDDAGDLRGRFVRAWPGRVYFFHTWGGGGYYFVCANGVVKLISESAARAIMAACLAVDRTKREAEAR